MEWNSLLFLSEQTEARLDFLSANQREMKKIRGNCTRSIISFNLNLPSIKDEDGTNNFTTWKKVEVQIQKRFFLRIPKPYLIKFTNFLSFFGTKSFPSLDGHTLAGQEFLLPFLSYLHTYKFLCLLKHNSYLYVGEACKSFMDNW